MSKLTKAQADLIRVLALLEPLGVGAFGRTVDELTHATVIARKPMSRPAVARALSDALERDTPLVTRAKGNTVGRPWKYTITFAGLAHMDDYRASGQVVS